VTCKDQSKIGPNHNTDVSDLVFFWLRQRNICFIPGLFFFGIGIGSASGRGF
jgi:hypothetical protein